MMKIKKALKVLSIFLFISSALSCATSSSNKTVQEKDKRSNKIEDLIYFCESGTTDSKKYCYELYQIWKNKKENDPEKLKLFAELEVIKENKLNLCKRLLREKEFSLAKNSCESICYKDFADPKACYLLGNIYLKIYKDKENSIKYIKKACDSGYGRACMDIVRETSKDNKINIKKHYALIKKACDSSKIISGEACMHLGLSLWEKDKEKALSYFQQACRWKYQMGCALAKNASECINKKDEYWCKVIKEFQKELHDE